MSEVATRPVLAMLLPNFSCGGAERVMVKVANLLHRQGYAVEMVVLKSEGEFLSELDTGISVVELNVSRALLGVLPVIRYLRRSRPRVLLSALNHMNVIALAARRLSRVPTSVVASVRCNVSEELAVPSSFSDRLLPGLIRYFYPKAETVLCVSKGVLRDLEQFAPAAAGRLKVIYNPVIDREFFARSVTPVPSPLHATLNRRFVLAVGRLSQQKGYDCLLKAFRLVREREDVQLLILGEGPERQALEQQAQALGIADEVLMPGFEPNPFPLMRACAVYVSSSRWEGLPGVLIQALATGARVVATDCPSGSSEILEDGVWGALVPVDDADALAQQILKSLQNKDGRRLDRLEASLKGRFGEEKVLSQYVELLSGFGLPPHR